MKDGWVNVESRTDTDVFPLRPADEGSNNGWGPMPNALKAIFVFEAIVTAGLALILALMLFVSTYPAWALMIITGMFALRIAILRGILLRGAWAHLILIVLNGFGLYWMILGLTAGVALVDPPGPIEYIGAVVSIVIIAYLLTRSARDWFYGSTRSPGNPPSAQPPT